MNLRKETKKINSRKNNKHFLMDICLAFGIYEVSWSECGSEFAKIVS